MSILGPVLKESPGSYISFIAVVSIGNWSAAGSPINMSRERKNVLQGTKPLENTYEQDWCRTEKM